MHRYLKARPHEDEDKTKEQLLEELHQLRSQLNCRQAGEPAHLRSAHGETTPLVEASFCEMILESFCDCIYALDGQWRLRYLNASAERLFMRRRGEVLGRVFWETYPQMADTVFWDHFHRALDEREDFHFEGLCPLSRRWVMVHLHPCGSGLSVQMQDISDRRESERLLGEQMKELERLNYLKDDFLSTVSHELRTPMANMIMAIRLLKGAPEDKRAAYLGILERECLRESNLINDLLDLQELTVKPRQRLREVINLREWLASLIEPFRSRAEQFQQHLGLEVGEGTPHLIADARSLERVVTELLNNACKYTVGGGSILVCAEAAQQASRSFVVLKVSNTGEIPLDEQKRIFDKFYRIPRSDSWAQGGTGLGLALVKRVVVENLAGEISVQSQGGLVTFAVHLPIAKPETSPPYRNGAP
jgi:signal transduction histidine kinase